MAWGFQIRLASANYTPLRPFAPCGRPLYRKRSGCRQVDVPFQRTAEADTQKGPSVLTMAGGCLLLDRPDVLHVLLPRLPASDLLRLGLTCKALLSRVLDTPSGYWLVSPGMLRSGGSLWLQKLVLGHIHRHTAVNSSQAFCAWTQQPQLQQGSSWQALSAVGAGIGRCQRCLSSTPGRPAVSAEGPSSTSESPHGQEEHPGQCPALQAGDLVAAVPRHQGASSRTGMGFGVLQEHRLQPLRQISCSAAFRTAVHPRGGSLCL